MTKTTWATWATWAMVVTLSMACGNGKGGGGGPFDPAMFGGSASGSDGKPSPTTTKPGGPSTTPGSTGNALAGASTGPAVATPVAGAANTVSGPAAATFTSWTPLHSFLGAPTVGGAVVSSKEAIVFTRDNHVGVTLDGGEHWGFERLTTGAAWAVAGSPGGPFVVVGGKGFMAFSADGKQWSDLPRLINDDLVNVSVGGDKIVAVGKNGGFITMDRDGSKPSSGYFPDKFKAGGVLIEGSHMVAVAGKKSLESSDGVSWMAIETPVASTPPGNATSQGLCGIGKLGKKRGVVCTVAGIAYGIGPTETIVVGSAWVAVTRTGKGWAMAPLPFKGVKNVVGTPGGPYHLGDGRGLVATSTDGKRWELGTDLTVLDGAPAFVPRSGPCDGALPAAQESCKLARVSTSPADMPDVGALRFAGDVGLAMGSAALVAMTTDGGVTWTSHNGFGLGGVQGFDLAGDTVVAIGLTKVAISTDGGKQFRTVDLPAKTPALLATRITRDGSVYVIGRAGTILKAEADLTSFRRLDTGAKNKSDYTYVHEAGGAVFVAGSRGELMRSGDQGSSWTPIATGLTVPLQKMASDGDVVLGVSAQQRFTGNKLLRSTDGGQHFFVQRELSEQGTASEFDYQAGVLSYDGMRSSDFGASWATAGPWHWEGSVDIGDGSGVRITNVSRYDSKDRFYVIGPTEGDLTIVDSFYNKGAWLRCAPSSGCWMVTGGQLYRPR